MSDLCPVDARQIDLGALLDDHLEHAVPHRRAVVGDPAGVAALLPAQLVVALSADGVPVPTLVDVESGHRQANWALEVVPDLEKDGKVVARTPIEA